MRSAIDRHRMTYQDLLALPDDGLRHELIDGAHFVTPAPASGLVRTPAFAAGEASAGSVESQLKSSGGRGRVSSFRIVLDF